MTQPVFDSNIKELPPYTREFLALLDRAIPHRCRERNESVRDHDRYAGMRELIDAMLVLQGELAEEAAKETPDAPETPVLATIGATASPLVRWNVGDYSDAIPSAS